MLSNFVPFSAASRLVGAFERYALRTGLEVCGIALRAIVARCSRGVVISNKVHQTMIWTVSSGVPWYMAYANVACPNLGSGEAVKRRNIAQIGASVTTVHK